MSYSQFLTSSFSSDRSGPEGGKTENTRREWRCQADEKETGNKEQSRNDWLIADIRQKWERATNGPAGKNPAAESLDSAGKNPRALSALEAKRSLPQFS